MLAALMGGDHRFVVDLAGGGDRDYQQLDSLRIFLANGSTPI